jgi:predicted MFS family arabinose efflux permease
MFVVACFTSPCCAPLYVPLALALLAGTPAAVWLTANVGWVDGALTLVSLGSLVVALRWWNGRMLPSRRSSHDKRTCSRRRASTGV